MADLKTVEEITMKKLKTVAELLTVADECIEAIEAWDGSSPNPESTTCLFTRCYARLAAFCGMSKQRKLSMSLKNNMKNIPTLVLPKPEEEFKLRKFKRCCVDFDI
jgi:hypothetical protein